MVLKTEGNTYATLAASPSPLRGKPTLAQDVAGGSDLRMLGGFGRTRSWNQSLTKSLCGTCAG